MRTVRCAIYTRKSSDEGLEQDFNSLDAQREACAAYVLSQASEGWKLLPEFYDDGGISGGTLERPALQRLLLEVQAKHIDIIVVYKVDRLTRSLLDFSKLVETFDSAGVSFVSVTQSFNTTTSMGRLTLNMLLSFAQFEREVTAERIRDKITASKAKGMWMGGVPPLGYEPDGRSLRIVPEHAALVRHIYDRYSALGNVRLIAEELTNEQVVSPPRTLRSGKAIGGRPFSRGQLYAMLRSPIYVGDIPHRGIVHPGQHEAIIDRGTWERVQTTLTDHVRGSRRGERTPSVSPLSGRVFDAAGRPLIASHTCKGTRRYRYYIGVQETGQAPLRIPAVELEGAVAACLATALDDPWKLCAEARFNIPPLDLGPLPEKARELAAQLRQRDRSPLRRFVSFVRVHDGQIEIGCDSAALGTELGLRRTDNAPELLELVAEVSLQRSGRAVRLVHTSGAAAETSPSPSLIKLVVKARRWWAVLRAGEIDVTRLAAREGVTPSYMTRVVRLTFLSPAIVDAIVSGTANADVDSEMLTGVGAVAPDWSEQARLMRSA
jgi:DNA invertase Pin-like site-specific DNA recombinase